jgi:hypothetical protein
MAHGDVSPLRGGRRMPPHGAGREPTPHFLSRKENAPLTVEKKQRRVPAKALAGIPAPGVTTGVGLGAALRCGGTIRERNFEIARAVDDCLCCHFAAANWQLKWQVRGAVNDCRCGHFAAAVRFEAETFCVGFTYPPLRPPDCGSKKTAGTIVKHRGFFNCLC